MCEGNFSCLEGSQSSYPNDDLFEKKWSRLSAFCINPCHAELYVTIYPLSPHDALKHDLTSMKTDLFPLQTKVLEWQFPWNWVTNAWHFSLLFHSHQITDIHYKSRIATAIRGL